MAILENAEDWGAVGDFVRGPTAKVSSQRRQILDEDDARRRGDPFRERERRTGLDPPAKERDVALGVHWFAPNVVYWRLVTGNSVYPGGQLHPDIRAHPPRTIGRAANE